MAPPAEVAPASRVHVGTSGWSYDHWYGCFYPERLLPGERLAFYATRFSTVEVNATFYRMPSERAVSAWAAATPDGFEFAVKGSRWVTHYRRLQDVERPVRDFVARMAGLGDKLAVVLWQLPPDLARDLELLEGFLATLPVGVRHAIEFRDRSWLVPEVFTALAERGIACVHIDSDRMPRDLTVTADFVYVRLHGRAGYHGAYTPPLLEPWAEFLSEQARLGRDGYVYFNNDAEGHAPADAARLAAMLGETALGAATAG